MLLIKNAHVKPITSPDLPCAQVLVDNGKIVALGEHVDAPASAESFDAQGRLVTPGLVDAHTHIGVSEECVRWEGEDCNEMSNPSPRKCGRLTGSTPSTRRSATLSPAASLPP